MGSGKINRRMFTFGGSALLLSQGALAEGHKGHGHHKMSGKMHGSLKEFRPLLQSTKVCLEAGHDCRHHCIDMMATGDTSIVDCFRSVEQMHEVVEALHHVAHAAESKQKQIVALAKVAADFCDHCAEKCKPHIKHHAQCKACYEACLDCAKECRKMAS